MSRTEENKALIRRYYDQLWNRWDLGVADAIISPGIHFRGSLGMSVEGIDGFKRYMETVRHAFPDFHNQIDELIAEGEKVVVRLTYSGTHWGELFGVGPTGRQVTYPGVAIFRIVAGEVIDGWVLGDTFALRQQLGALSS